MTQQVRTVESEIRALFNEWFTAIDNRDAGYVDRHMTDSFTIVDYFGNQLTRSQYQAMFDTCAPGYKGVHEWRDFQVCVPNERCAIAFGRYYAEMRFADGREVALTVRFATTWVREGETWKCAFYHGAKADDAVAAA